VCWIDRLNSQPKGVIGDAKKTEEKKTKKKVNFFMKEKGLH